MMTNMEIFNEFCILLISIALLQLTPVVTDIEARNQIGVAMITLTSLNMLTNIAIIFGRVTMSIIEKVNHFRKQRKAKLN